MLLQETHSCLLHEQKWKTEWGADIFFSHGESNARGVAILCPVKKTYDVVKVDNDMDGRFVLLELNVDGKNILLCNIYAPTQEPGFGQTRQMAFFHTLKDKLTPYADRDVDIIIGGDFNTHLNPKLDKQHCSSENKAKTDFANNIINLCKEMNLADCWRIMNSDTARYTWRQPNPIRQSRLDYWLVSVNILNSIENCDIQPSYKSDHSLITLDTKSEAQNDRGPGMWKFNVSLLKNQDYVECVNTWLTERKHDYEYLEDKALKWDLIKCDLRRDTISFSKKQAKKRKELFVSLSKSLIKLESELVDNPSPVIMQEYQVVKQEIDNIISFEAQGLAFRSRVDHTEFNEKNSSYFANLEKRNYKRKTITNLFVNEQLINDPNIIRKEQELFYKELYSSKMTDSNIEAQYLEQSTPHVDEEKKEMCDKDIDILELGQALKALPNGKTPGSDGFGVDFYKFFWGSIKELVFDSLTYSLERGELSVEQRRGMITLIPKKDKDTRYLKNWRPISLLNTDYKILTKLLAARMKKVLPDIIHTDQVGYVEGRYIGQNIRTIVDMIEHAHMTQTPAMAVFLDFEKAFDSIEWSFLQKSLSVFGFGPKFVNWVNIIYTNTNASVINNGFTTDYFTLERGIRQGCPLSAYLFIVAVELLAINIRDNEQIKGINVHDTCIKLIQMADDMTVFLKDVNSLKLLLSNLYSFSKASGLKLNKTKTEAIWLGRNEGSQEQPCGLKWATEVYSLGIWFSTNQEEGLNRNFAAKFDKFSRALNMWKGRELSTKGKITVIKNIAMPILLYVTSSLPIPEWLADKVTQKVYEFIWNNKPDKVSRETLTAEIEKGGLKMINIEKMFKAQKIMWVKRLVSATPACWKAFPSACLEPIGTDIFKCSFNPDYMPLNLPLFYHQVLYAWGECKLLSECRAVRNAWDVRRQSLFYNANILIDSMYIGTNFMNWHKKGIFLLHDILDDKGNFLNTAEIETLYDVKVDVLRYNGLKDAIPRQWRHLVTSGRVTRCAISKDENVWLLGKNNAIKPVSLVSNAEIYHIIHQVHTQPKSTLKWAALFPFHDFQWNKIFRLPFDTVRCTLIQTFQFKILHRYFPCNYWLAKWELNSHESCVRCQETDSLEHYFYHCNVINRLWKSFVTWWGNNMNEIIELKNVDVLFGSFKSSSNFKALNFCILYVKKFISQITFQGNVPYLYGFLVQLKHKLICEKCICNRNGNSESFNRNFQNLLNALG